MGVFVLEISFSSIHIRKATLSSAVSCYKIFSKLPLKAHPLNPRLLILTRVIIFLTSAATLSATREFFTTGTPTAYYAHVPHTPKEPFTESVKRWDQVTENHSNGTKNTADHKDNKANDGAKSKESSGDSHEKSKSSVLTSLCNLL